MLIHHGNAGPVYLEDGDLVPGQGDAHSDCSWASRAAVVVAAEPVAEPVGQPSVAVVVDARGRLSAVRAGLLVEQPAGYPAPTAVH